MILQKKRRNVPPSAPGVIEVGNGGIYKFIPTLRSIPKKKFSIPEGIEFQILAACCEIIDGKTGPDNQVQIFRRKTFFSTRITNKNKIPKNPNTPKSRF